MTTEGKRTRGSVQQLERNERKASHPHGYSTTVAVEIDYDEVCSVGGCMAQKPRSLALAPPTSSPKIES
ncbi:hypothetical protein Y032_0014g2473 [Ancylostoma ceylanicum]|uniref:Uncharacterized protein n=1 Tax=Ancylostoma ceylanicum TaxID=53326 RepID=A0A016VCB0_9BILA|nr:hypothetical protein Y032_0014g2473 [Ancylostoma ceylanicum]